MSWRAPTVPRGVDPRLLLAGAAACWGIGTAVSKQAVADVPAVTLLAAQLLASVAALLIAGRATGLRLRPRPDEHAIVRLGLLNPGLAYALGLIGLTQISASLSVLIWALEPIAILGLAMTVLAERPGPRVMGLSAVAVVGLLTVLYDPAAGGQVGGIAISAAGVACCALYTIAARAWLRASDSTLAVIAGQQVLALGLAALLVVAVAVLGGRVVPAVLSPLTAVSVVGSGLLYYAAAYWLYLSALRTVPAAVASTSFYLIPVFGLAAAAGFGERLTSLQWLGAAVVIAALVGIAAGLGSRAAMPAAQPERVAG